MPVLNNSNNAAPQINENAKSLNSEPLQHGLDAKLEAFMNTNKDIFPNLADAAPAAKMALTEDASAPGDNNLGNGDPVEQAAGNEEAPKAETQPQDEVAERKAFIKKDKEARAAKAEVKTLKQKADTYEALQAAKASKDPNKILEAAGLDPNDFYNWVIESAKGEKKAVLDPKEQAITDKLTAYEKRIQEQEEKIATQESQRQIDNTITNLVLPLVVKAPGDYETLLTLKKGDHRAVAQYIFDTAAAIHQQTGEVVPLDQVAAQLEKYEWDKIETGYIAVSKMNKFAAKYGSQQSKEPSSTTDKVEVRQPDNRQKQQVVATVSAPTRSIYDGPMSQDDRVAEALKRAGL
jgi:hypothetical protein